MENFIKGVWAFWKETWRQDKVLFFCEAIGTLLGMAAATVMSFQAPNPNLFIVFLFYIISGVLLMYTSYKRHASWMVILMGFYTVTTSFGMVRLFI